MILLISPSERGAKCVAMLKGLIKEPVQLAITFKQALGLLRAHSYSVVVVDECLLDLNPGDGDLLVRRLGEAMPVYVNLAVSASARVAQQVRAALRRRSAEHSAAVEVAEKSLRNELRNDLTALLLSSEMALTEPLSAASAERLKSVRDLAARMKSRLQLG